VAQQEARDLRGPRIEPVHLLLRPEPGPPAAAGPPCGPSASTHRRRPRAGAAGPLDADALAAVGIDLDRVRAAAESAFGPGALDAAAGQPRATSLRRAGSKQALEGALRSVLAVPRRRRARVIDTGHLVVGVLSVPDPVVRRVLRLAGVDVVRLREELGTAAAA
jgi:hypothetical protein